MYQYVFFSVFVDIAKHHSEKKMYRFIYREHNSFKEGGRGGVGEGGGIGGEREGRGGRGRKKMKGGGGRGGGGEGRGGGGREGRSRQGTIRDASFRESASFGLPMCPIAHGTYKPTWTYMHVHK